MRAVNTLAACRRRGLIVMVMRQPKKGREEPALRPGSADPKDKNKIKRIGKKTVFWSASGDSDSGAVATTIQPSAPGEVGPDRTLSLLLRPEGPLRCQ